MGYRRFVTVLEIVQIGHPTLRARAREVTDGELGSPELQAHLRRPRRDDARGERRRARRSAGRHPPADLRRRGRRQSALPVQAAARPSRARQSGRARRCRTRRTRATRAASAFPTCAASCRAHAEVEVTYLDPGRRRSTPSASVGSAPARCSTSSTTSTASSSRTGSRTRDALHLGDVPRPPPGGVAGEHSDRCSHRFPERRRPA